MRKENSFEWKEEQQKAFEELKNRLISAPILSYPDFEKPFIIMTNASILELGTILAQKDNQNQEVVIQYASQ